MPAMKGGGGFVGGGGPVDGGGFNGGGGPVDGGGFNGGGGPVDGGGFNGGGGPVDGGGFNGGGGGAGAGSSYKPGTAPPPKRVTIVGPLVVAHKIIRFRIQRQEQSDWCWAAVATSIEHYFDHESKLKQCDVANKVIPVEYGEGLLPPSDDECCCHCCCHLERCDLPAKLEIALQQVYKWRNTLLRALTFEEIQREIDGGRPIGAGIKWMSGGQNGTPGTSGHFVVIRGYRLLSSGACQVYVADPLNASGLVDFDEFTFAYYGEGQWVETHLVQRGWE
jgi:hypothetical protein